jgi:hypothetical protein
LYFVLQFFFIKTLDPVKKPDSLEMLDTDPDSQHRLEVVIFDLDPELFLTDFTHSSDLLSSTVVME